MKRNLLATFYDARCSIQSVRAEVILDAIDDPYKAVGTEATHYNNAIGMATRDCLRPYSFRWTEQQLAQHNLIWEWMSSQFNIQNTLENRESIFRQSRKCLADWKHDLNRFWDQVFPEFGVEVA